MEKILLTGGTTAFAQRVTKLFPGDHFVFADSHAIPSPLLQSGRYIHIPSPKRPSFVHELLKLCLDLGITRVIPLRKEELVPLAQSKLLFEEYGILMLLPSIEALQKVSIQVNPTSRTCSHIVVKGRGEEGFKDGDPHALLGIYSQDEDGQFILCCLA